jgi:hypothetical protein
MQSTRGKCLSLLLALVLAGAALPALAVDLVGGQPFVLQFSNAPKDNILLTITPSPPRKL